MATQHVRTAVAFGLGFGCAIAAVAAFSNLGSKDQEPLQAPMATGHERPSVDRSSVPTQDATRIPLAGSDTEHPSTDILPAPSGDTKDRPTNEHDAGKSEKLRERDRYLLFDKDLPDAKSMAASTQYNPLRAALSDEDLRSLQSIIDELNQSRSDIVNAEEDLTDKYFQEKFARKNYRTLPKEAKAPVFSPSGTRVWIQNSESSPDQTIVELLPGEFPDLDTLGVARQRAVLDSQTRITTYFRTKSDEHRSTR